MGELKRLEEALAAYEQVVGRFGEAEESELRERVAEALVKKGHVLGELKRPEEELVAYAHVMERFGKAEEAALREQVAWALNGKAFSFLCDAKRLWRGGEEGQARALLGNAEKDIRDALGRMPDSAIALGNHGYITFLLGRKDEARKILAQAIALGGESVREAELQDAEIHSLPQDEEFKDLVRSISAASGASAAADGTSSS